MTVALPKHVSVTENIVFETLNNNTILLNMEKGFYYELDDVGTKIWQLLLENGEVQFILDKMLAEYNVDKETLSFDLNNLFSELATEGFLTLDV